MLEEIKSGLDEYIRTWSRKENKNARLLNEWKRAVLDLVETKIIHLKNGKFKSIMKPRRVLDTKEAKDELERLQKNYVLVPTDKASNNISFICRKFYIEKILEEVSKDTYEKVHDTSDVVVNRLENLASRKYNMKLEPKDKELPRIYMMPKMHKSPTGFRFIIASKRNPLKGTAKLLTKILKVIMDTHFAYNRKIKLYTGINRMWICQNNVSLLQEIRKVNARSGARNVDTFDFSTLYTKINLQDLAEKLKWCIEKAFKGGNNQKITVGRYFTKWGSLNKGRSFSKEDIFSMVDDIVFNAYFHVADEVYRQIIGIPMGIDPAPFMANLYLYTYEFDKMEELTRSDRGVALKFNKTFRFIDDLIDLNNDGVMERIWKEIYPPELILKKENPTDQKATFLDLNIEIIEKKFVTKLYDKRDNFKFNIVSYPDLSGNIPAQPAYGVFTAQMLRVLRASTYLDDANDRIAEIACKLKKQGFEKEKLCRCGYRLLPKHPWILEKFGMDFNLVLRSWRNSWMWVIL